MSRWLPLVFVLGCGAPPHPVVASPKGAIPQLDYFVGSWHVEAKNPQSGKAFTFTYRVEPVLRGRWYQGTGIAPAPDLEIRDLWGVDAMSGEVVRSIFDSANTRGTVRSKGWQGDTLVLEGDAATSGGAIHVRETITRKGPDEFHAVWEARDGDAWSAYSIEVLRRQK